MMSEKTQLNIPRHIAIIMDGNGRWAKKRLHPRTDGHRAGADAVIRVTQAARDLGVEYLTLYAFSTENWKRPAEEVGALMSLLSHFLDSKLEKLIKDGVRLKTIGRTGGLPEPVRSKLLNAVEKTRQNTAQTLVLALNYGGRAELTDAAGKIAADAAAGRLDPEKMDETVFRQYLYDPEIPDPDLMIRTSGELRLSNFLLWQLAYTELYVTDVLWPDFDRNDLVCAIEQFNRRDRRFGAINESSL